MFHPNRSSLDKNITHFFPKHFFFLLEKVKYAIIKQALGTRPTRNHYLPFVAAINTMKIIHASSAPWDGINLHLHRFIFIREHCRPPPSFR